MPKADTQSESLFVDEIEISVRRSKRRKTVGITVDRTGEILVAAPVDADLAKVDEILQSQKLWIYTKLAEKENFHLEPIVKQYVDGACFFYLGQAHRLKLIPRGMQKPGQQPLTLADGRFYLIDDQVEYAADHFKKWYAARGRETIARHIELLGKRIEVPTKHVVRDLGFRWGSCGCEGNVLISWRTIQLPPKMIEYVVGHELVHLLHRNHDRDFWNRLGRVIPDYEERKEWLAVHGEKFAAKF